MYFYEVTLRNGRGSRVVAEVIGLYARSENDARQAALRSLVRHGKTGYWVASVAAPSSR